MIKKDDFALKIRSKKQAVLMKIPECNKEIKHPHFVQIYGVETTEKCSIIAMELADKNLA